MDTHETSMRNYEKPMANNDNSSEKTNETPMKNNGKPFNTNEKQ